jgi:hypothetical protein
VTGSCRAAGRDALELYASVALPDGQRTTERINREAEPSRILGRVICIIDKEDLMSIGASSSMKADAAEQRTMHN